MEGNQHLFNCLTRFFSLSLSYAHQLRLTDRLGRATARSPAHTSFEPDSLGYREREQEGHREGEREREIEMGERREIKKGREGERGRGESGRRRRGIKLSAD